MLDAYQFHLKLRRLRSLPSMIALFRSSIAPFGFDTFACGELDLTERARSVFYVIDWPDRWRNFYLKSGLIERDPVVETLAHRRDPYTWTDLRRDRKFGQLGRDALKLAAAHGWVQGFVVPMPCISRRVGLVSLAGTREEISAEARAYLALISMGFQMHVRVLVGHQGFAVPPAGLTQREIDSVCLVAQGHSDKAIASRLGVAPSTSHEFIEKAKRRLKARTRMQMVAIAVSLGIVDPFQQLPV
jgi:DNA-binding CsgD family transcriptional regulator